MHTPFMRRISTLVLLTFTSLTLQPLQAAAQGKFEPAKLAQPRVTQSAPPSHPEKASRLLEAIKETAKRAKDKAGKGQSTFDDVKELRRQKKQLDALEQDILGDFAATETHIKAKNLSPEILARHQAAVRDYKARQTQFKQKFKTLEDDDDRDDDKARSISVTDLASWLDQNQPDKPHAKTDPNKLPFRTPDAKVRAPIETAQGFKTGLFKQQPLHLAGPLPAGTNLFAAITDPNAPPIAADLAATEDVQITPAIQAKAAELKNSPVLIHNWVRNTIEFIPSYGSIQGSEMTLQAKRGNAFDTASLEIALLRAAGIPARYVYGTIQLPVNQVMNWVGGVTKPEAAQNLLGQGGIPNIGLVSGGQVSHIKMEHVWVSAYVDYIPSRGAVNKNPNTWVPLDGSFKQYQYTQGMDIKGNVPLDAASLLAQAQSGATVNTAEGWVQNLNQTNIQSALTGYQAQVQNYVNAQNANATVGDVLGSKSILQKNYSILMGTLPYKTLAVGSSFSQVPDSLKWKININLYTSELDKANRIPQMSVGLPLATIGTKRLAATYAPSTESDAQVISSYQSSTKLPVYLVKQTLKIYLDDQQLAEYSPQSMGSGQFWTYTLAIPGSGEIEEDFKLYSTVGDQIVFGVNGGGVNFEQVANRYTSVNPNTTLENLHHLALGYWARADISDQMLASGQYQAATYRLPSVGMFTHPVSVDYFYGLPALGSYKSYSIDIRRLTGSAVMRDGSNPSEYVLQTGFKNSFLEGRIFEEIFDYAPGNGFSAVSVIGTAIRQGLQIWKVTAENLQLFLESSIVSSDVKQEIEHAVNSGLVVFSPESGVDVGFWAGQGYISIDPETGAGAYILNSANGADFDACEKKSEPLTKSINQQILTYIAIALAAAIIATGTPGGGRALPAIGIAMLAVGITTLTYSETSYAAGKCPTAECHRGSIQAQGRDIAGPGKENSRTKSAPWAQPKPLTLAQGLQKLEELKQQLTPAELEKRLAYFDEAETKMREIASSGGVCAPFSRSYGPNRAIESHVSKGIRVDVNVNEGQAFAP